MTISAQSADIEPSYGRVSRTFHWLTAAFILTLIPLGLVADAWPYGTSDELATKAVMFSLHKTMGLAVFFVALLRMLWTLSRPCPGPLHPERRLETFVAAVVHWMLYVALLIVPLSGWLHHAATTGFAPVWWPFGQHLPLVPIEESAARFFGAWHYVFTRILIAALLLHVVGALKHQFVDRDGTLRRMLRGGNTGIPAPAAERHTAPAIVALSIWASAVAVAVLLAQSGPSAAPMRQTGAAENAAGWTVTDGSLAIHVRQLGSDVAGQFRNWSAAIDFDPATDTGHVRVEIDVFSLSVGSVTEQALGPEFFAAGDHPVAVFEGDITSAETGGSHVVNGILTLKGVSQPLDLPFNLAMADGIATVTGQTVIDRRGFGIGTDSYDDERTVGFNVKVQIELTANRTE